MYSEYDQSDLNTLKTRCVFSTTSSYVSTDDEIILQT